MVSYTLGTAGHIDHGKTALVKAITGIDTDTLKEERERGITVDIGFAHWENGITFIDVPGHERFISNMAAGVNTIDYALLVIAADDGIMPQTREHLDILKWLNIPAGAVVITKSDLADSKKISVLKDDISRLTAGSFLEKAPVFAVSVRNMDSLEPLKTHLLSLPEKKAAREYPQSFRMFIDRVFIKPGYGTVVTGTVISGHLKTGDTVVVYPQTALCRVRGIQIRYADSEAASAGDRAAINIAGMDKEIPERGSVLVAPDVYEASSVYYANVRFGKSVRPYSALRLLAGTAEFFARLSPVKGLPWPEHNGYVMIRINLPMPLAAGDRFVLREKNATATVGGGVIACSVQTRPATFAPDFLDLLAERRYNEMIQRLFSNSGFIDLPATGRLTGIDVKTLEMLAGETLRDARLRKTAGLIVSQTFMDRLKKEITERLRKFHEAHPSQSGARIQDFMLKHFLSIEPLLFNFCTEEMTADGIIVKTGQEIRLSDHRIRLDDKEEAGLAAVERLLTEQKFQPPPPSELSQKLRITEKETLNRLHRLVTLKKAVKTDPNLFFHESAIRQARQLLIDFIKKNNHISFQDFKKLTGVSRKYALALLEYFDKTGLTIREGECRILVSSDEALK